jgi:hypothetical protein
LDEGNSNNGGRGTTQENQNQPCELQSNGRFLESYVKIMPEYYKVLPGSKVIATNTIINLDIKEAKGVVLDYSLRYANGTKIVSEQEKVSVGTKLQVVKELIVPENLAIGTYNFVLEASYNGETISAQDSFSVVNKLEIQASQRMVEIGKISSVLLVLVFIAAAVLLIWHFTKRKKEHKYLPHHIVRKKNQHLLVTLSIVGWVLFVLILLIYIFNIPIKGILSFIFQEAYVTWAVLLTILILLVFVLKELRKISKHFHY